MGKISELWRPRQKTAERKPSEWVFREMQRNMIPNIIRETAAFLSAIDEMEIREVHDPQIERLAKERMVKAEDKITVLLHQGALGLMEIRANGAYDLNRAVPLWDEERWGTACYDETKFVRFQKGISVTDPTGGTQIIDSRRMAVFLHPDGTNDENTNGPTFWAIPVGELTELLPIRWTPTK